MPGQDVGLDARSGRRLGCPDRPGRTMHVGQDEPRMPGQAGHDETSMTKPSLPDATGNPQSEHAGPGFQLSTKTVLFVPNGELEVPEEYN